MLSLARLRLIQERMQDAKLMGEEALESSLRCENRLDQADANNLLSQLALATGSTGEARKHAEIAKERAWCDGPPYCYRLALDEAERLLREGDQRS